MRSLHVVTYHVCIHHHPRTHTPSHTYTLTHIHPHIHTPSHIGTIRGSRGSADAPDRLNTVERVQVHQPIAKGGYMIQVCVCVCVCVCVYIHLWVGCPLALVPNPQPLTQTPSHKPPHPPPQVTGFQIKQPHPEYAGSVPFALAVTGPTGMRVCECSLTPACCVTVCRGGVVN